MKEWSIPCVTADTQGAKDKIVGESRGIILEKKKWSALNAIRRDTMQANALRGNHRRSIAGFSEGDISTTEDGKLEQMA